MSFVYFGTSEFAAAVLADLVAGGNQPVLVVTRPDAPKGRGRKLSPPPVALQAQRLGIELAQPTSLEHPDFIATLDQLQPDSAVLCAYGALIREPLLSRWQILNLHPSLLPRWRGAAPIERAIMDGDEATGVSIIRLVEELDAGPVCLVEETPIGPDDDFQSLSDRLQAIGARLLASALADQSRGHLFFEDQSAQGISYAERITAEDRLIDPSRPAKELERLVRALRPHIGARLLLPSGEGLGVRRAMVRESGLSQGQLGGEEGELILGCAEGSLVITRVIPAGGREMDADDWLRGGPALT